MRVLVFGDSIAYGASDLDGGWVARLQRYFKKVDIENNTDVMPDVYNVSISGDKTADLLYRFENETIVRSRDNDICIVVAIGINDTQIDTGKAVSNIEQYLEGLNSLNTISKKYTDKICFLGLTPTDDNHSNPLEWPEPGFDLISYNNERIKSFDVALKTFCQENTICYINIYDKFLKEFTTPERTIELLPDALHPSGKGHTLIYEIIEKQLIEFIKK